LTSAAPTIIVDTDRVNTIAANTQYFTKIDLCRVCSYVYSRYKYNGMADGTSAAIQAFESTRSSIVRASWLSPRVSELLPSTSSTRYCLNYLSHATTGNQTTFHVGYSTVIHIPFGMLAKLTSGNKAKKTTAQSERPLDENVSTSPLSLPVNSIMFNVSIVTALIRRLI
jgi:hypothetical protein